MFIYLACPYSHPNPKVRQQRFEAVCKCAANMLRNGLRFYAPIAHTHPIAEHGVLEPTNWQLYQPLDLEFLRRADDLWIVNMDGWWKSVGVNAEAETAAFVDIPIALVNVMGNVVERLKDDPLAWHRRRIEEQKKHEG